MGTFAGHALPGTFLFLLGTWWTFGAWRVYILRRRGHRNYSCTAAFTFPKLPERLCIEGLAKVVSACVGVAAEVATGFKHGRFTEIGNAQHTSMYIFYGLSGLADILTVHRAPIPRGTDYGILLMTVCVEGLLFYFHLHGRTQLDVLVHTLLVYTIVAEAACIAVEMVQRRSTLAALGRSFFGVMQGTWFFQIGFILHNPLPNSRPWDENHQNMMWAAVFYTWHMIGVMVHVGLMGVFAWLWCMWCEGFDKTEDVCYSLVSTRPQMMESDAGDKPKTDHRTESDNEIFS
ncbi:transmembrane protein 45B [Ixodes scapularis]|uniref:transmembrane protein 45B n=1 Tax=Ixodes scapularis TaxID=6945 RepID=UPI001A9E4CD9|nr:transmembrane protein 45B [Ixodes scapularis]